MCSLKGQTWEVPAATSRAASHPATFIDRNRPGHPYVILQTVGGEVTHLKFGESLLELIKGHPGKKKDQKESL